MPTLKNKNNLKYDIFISHSSRDNEFALKLAHDLKQKKITVWIDILNLVAGQTIIEGISKALNNSKLMIIIMSPSYFESIWTKNEYNIGLNKEFESGNIFVIPLYLVKTQIPTIISSKLYSDFRNLDHYDDNFTKLVNQISTNIENTRLIDPLKENVFGKVTNQINVHELESIKDEIINFNLKSKDLVSPTYLKKPNNEKVCFIIMPFSIESLNDVYELYIKGSIEEKTSFICVRGDDIFGSNIIYDDILNSIKNADIILADLTGKNANVFYEVGISHTLNKKVILLAQSMDDVPFDLKHFRICLYDTSPRGLMNLRSVIPSHIRAYD